MFSPCDRCIIYCVKRAQRSGATVAPGLEPICIKQSATVGKRTDKDEILVSFVIWKRPIFHAQISC